MDKIRTLEKRMPVFNQTFELLSRCWVTVTWRWLGSAVWPCLGVSANGSTWRARYTPTWTSTCSMIPCPPWTPGREKTTTTRNFVFGHASLSHIRTILTEGKAAVVVAAVWGTELFILAALAIFHQDDMKKMMNCTRMIWRKGLIEPGWYEEKDEFILFFKLSWCKKAGTAKNWISYVP